MSIPTDATHGIDFVVVWDLESEFQIPDFISFIRAGNPVFGPKMSIGNRGFGCLFGIVVPKNTMSIPTDATHGIDFVIVWDLESWSQKHNGNTNRCKAWY